MIGGWGKPSAWGSKVNIISFGSGRYPLPKELYGKFHLLYNCNGLCPCDFMFIPLHVWLCPTVVVNDKYLGSKEKKKICLTWSYAPTVKKWSLYIQIKEKCKHQLIYSCRQFQNPLSCVFCVQGPKAKKAWPNILLSLKHCVIRSVAWCKVSLDPIEGGE